MARILRVMRFLTAISILAAAALLCWQCIDIYADGASKDLSESAAIFHVTDINSRFKALTAPLTVCGLMTSLTVILEQIGSKAAFSADIHWRCIVRPCKAEPLRHRHILRVMILCAAVAFILLGVMNGGAYDVLIKAINICTECIGLG